ncbi:MAG: hypothetical protein Q9218_007277 [Villophora microphyllina]
MRSNIEAKVMLPFLVAKGLLDNEAVLARIFHMWLDWLESEDDSKVHRDNMITAQKFNRAMSLATSGNRAMFGTDRSSPPEAVSTTSASSSEASKPTAKASGIASPAEPTAINGTTNAGNSTTNGTVSATSTSTAAATDSAALPDTPNTTTKCRIDHANKPDEDIMPFCEPKEGQYVFVGENYPGTSSSPPLTSLFQFLYRTQQSPIG